MNCRQARRIVLGSLGEPAAYLEHLASCPECARERREQERLLGDLALLRTEAPFEIDVRERVMAALAKSAATRARSLGPALGWLLLGSVASAAGIVWSAIDRAETLRSVARLLARTAFQIVAKLEDLLRPAAALVSACRRLLASMLEVVVPILEHAFRLLPSFQASLVAALTVMTLVTVLGVRRELRRAPYTEEL